MVSLPTPSFPTRELVPVLHSQLTEHFDAKSLLLFILESEASVYSSYSGHSSCSVLDLEDCKVEMSSFRQRGFRFMRAVYESGDYYNNIG